MAMEWTVTEPGHHTLIYRGRKLEITRRKPDTWERRTYVVHVDGRQEPVPVWDLKSAKTKALRAVMNNPESGREIKRLTKVRQEEVAREINGQINGHGVEVLEKAPAVEPEVLPEVLENLVTDQAPEPEHEHEQVPSPAEVHFTITGSFPLSKLGTGYNTLETVMQALRELGPASCSVKSPKEIEL